MLQIAILMVAAFLTTSYTVMTERTATERISTLRADVAASNFLSYREALVRYLNTNAGATGTISDASLTWQTGYIRDARWTNVIAGGVLYTYSVAAPPPGMTNAVYQKTGNNVMVGIKQSNGDLAGLVGTLPANLPATIPVGAIVYIGS